MTLIVHYKLKIADWQVNSADDPHTEFHELEVVKSLGPAADSCRVAVHAPPAPEPSLLEQAATAAAGALGLGDEEEDLFSVQVRGNAIKTGDIVDVELTAGDRTGQAMSAQVQSIRSDFGITEILGATGKSKLAAARANQVYENQDLSQITADLAKQTEVDVGDVDAGGTYPYLVVDESKSVLGHLVELAQQEGLDLFFAADNRLYLKKFSKGSADHTFYFGIDILDLQLTNFEPPVDRVKAVAESPASNQGTDTWHWLTKDPSPFMAEAGDGNRPASYRHGSIRTKDAASALAVAKLGSFLDTSSWGRLKVLGRPDLQLADAIEIKNVEKPELNGMFKVTGIKHVLNKRDGFVTFVHFTGQGGADKAGGLLGGLAGLAGGLGL